jgi:hypothetical protein
MTIDQATTPIQSKGCCLFKRYCPANTQSHVSNWCLGLDRGLIRDIWTAVQETRCLTSETERLKKEKLTAKKRLKYNLYMEQAFVFLTMLDVGIMFIPNLTITLGAFSNNQIQWAKSTRLSLHSQYYPLLINPKQPAKKYNM